MEVVGKLEWVGDGWLCTGGGAVAYALTAGAAYMLWLGRFNYQNN